jgi:Xaa-Pro aminopeptidase
MKELAKLNRTTLFKEMKEDSYLVLFSGEPLHKSADEEYPFSVNRNFYYLTTIKEPHLILLMEKKEGKEKTTLFIEEADLFYEKWVGKKISSKEAKVQSGIQEICYIKEFEETFLQLARENETLYLDLKENESYPILATKWRKSAKKENSKLTVKDVYPVIAKLRSVKSKYEVEELTKAIHTTNLGLQNIMKNLKAGNKEYHAEADFDYILKTNNTSTSFSTIAASGVNAVTLHYTVNDADLKNKELLLLDLGATNNLYCADITRTYPINGKFTKRQKELYEMVLTIQKQIISAICPGTTMAELNQLVIEYYKKELLKKGIIKKEEDYTNYYYHGVSHSLGLDTHDIGLPRDHKLVAGNVITVEPGIYIKEEGIGIRIEDDVLVTENGCINLSAEIIKEVDEIEAFMEK